MQYPRGLVLIPALVLGHLATLGCHVEVGGTGCAPAQTSSGKVIQQAYKELFDDCWEEPQPGAAPAAETAGDAGGACVAPMGEDPCAACILMCALDAGDDCATGTATSATLDCAQAHCAAECPRSR